MKKAAAHPTTKSLSDKTGYGAGAIAMQFFDTTWRIAVPVLLFALIGIFIDKSLGTKPLCTLLGVIVGFIIVGLLIKRLLDAALNEEDNL
jgi:F0F1-type ATP synthase assembly protein I